MPSRFATLFGYAILALGLAACGDTTATIHAGDQDDTAEGSIVGGTPATGPRYDAVGALVTIAPDGGVSPFCTGTLIEKDLVVTAKHCFFLTPASVPVGFAIGYDGFRPSRVVRGKARLWERTVTQGIMSLGSDVAVLVLEEKIEGIKPAKVGSSPQPGTYESVGYGRQAYTFDNPPLPITFGTRHRGTMALAAVGPTAYWPVVYEGDFDKFFSDFTDGTNDPARRPAAEGFWSNYKLAPDYDAVFRRVTSNVASGDSGGPVLQRKGGRWWTYGVASGGVFITGNKDNQPRRNFAVYSAFGPGTNDFLEAAEECGGTPREGICDGNTLRACVRAIDAEGELEFEESSAACGATCVQAPRGAQCAPACTANADCGSIAANGVCSAGRCTWSGLEMCKAEPGNAACFFCCLGATGFNAQLCSISCFARPPPRGVKRRTGQLPRRGGLHSVAYATAAGCAAHSLVGWEVSGEGGGEPHHRRPDVRLPSRPEPGDAAGAREIRHGGEAGVVD